MGGIQEQCSIIMDALFLKSYYSDESDVSLPTYEEV